MLELLNVEYERELITRVKEMVEPECEILGVDIYKCNQFAYRGLICKQPNKGKTMMSAVANISTYIEANTDLDVAARFVVSAFKLSPPFDMEMFERFLDFEKVKSRIRIKLINKARNLRYLERLETLDFLDLAIVPYVLLDDEAEEGMYSFNVTKQIANVWKLEASQLCEIAIDNVTKAQDWSVRDMENVMHELIAHSPAKVGEQNDYDVEQIDEKMLVVTNKTATEGASVILCADVIREIQQQVGEDFVVLPSSRHETIVIPAGVAEPAMLKDLVKQVNEEQVSPEDFLADNVYFYNHITGGFEFLI